MVRDKILRNDDENIEMFPMSNIIRVTGTERRCENAVKWIKNTLKTIERTTISLANLIPLHSGDGRGGKHSLEKIEKWADRHFDDATLLELGKLTNSYITRLAGKSASQKRQVCKKHWHHCLL
jgi:uncharacterized protein HemY